MSRLTTQLSQTLAAERAGGKAAGRHLEPEPVELGDLGAAEELVWPAPYPMVLTNEEISNLDLIGGGAFPVDLIERRMAGGEVCMGLGFVVGLLRGCRSAGVTQVRDWRVQRRLHDDSGVSGVEAQADSLSELAMLSGIDNLGLKETVDRFNRLVQAGKDDDFGRGSSHYDRGIGDPTAPHPNLGAIEQPPFFALRIHRGTVGTKGGPRTDSRAQVLGWNGAPIPGLYAAGNAAASVIGPGTIAPGLTLGLALTWGWIAGTSAGGGNPG